MMKRSKGEVPREAGVEKYDETLELLRMHLAKSIEMISKTARKQGVKMNLRVDLSDLSKISSRDLVSCATEIKDNEALWNSLPNLVHFDLKEGETYDIEKTTLRKGFENLIALLTRFAGPF